MGSPLEIVLWAVATPAVVAAVLFLVLRWALPDEVGQRYAAAVAFAAAYLAGHLLTSAEFVPSRHWHWLPYLAAAAGILSPLSLARGVGHLERITVVFLSSLVASWFLVPDWQDLKPPRLAWILILAVGFAMAGNLLTLLAKRLPAPRLLALLSLPAVTVSGLSAYLVSVTYASVNIAAAAALLGLAIAARFVARASAGAIGVAYVWVVGGWSFVVCIDPQEPIYGVLAVPFAPLALWCCVVGPLARLKGASLFAVQAGAVIAVLAVASGITIARTGF